MISIQKLRRQCLVSSPYGPHTSSPRKNSSALKSSLGVLFGVCTGMEGVGSGKMIPHSIAEDDEEEEWTEERLNITGHSSAILSELHVLIRPLPLHLPSSSSLPCSHTFHISRKRDEPTISCSCNIHLT